MALLSTLLIMYATFVAPMPVFVSVSSCPMPTVRRALSARSPTVSDTETSFLDTLRLFAFWSVWGDLTICSSAVTLSFSDSEFLVLRAERHPTVIVSCWVVHELHWVLSLDSMTLGSLWCRFAVRASGYKLLVCWFLVSVYCFLNLPVLFMYDARAIMQSVFAMISWRLRWLLVIFLSSSSRSSISYFTLGSLDIFFTATFLS